MSPEDLERFYTSIPSGHQARGRKMTLVQDLISNGVDVISNASGATLGTVNIELRKTLSADGSTKITLHNNTIKMNTLHEEYRKYFYGNLVKRTFKKGVPTTIMAMLFHARRAGLKFGELHYLESIISNQRTALELLLAIQQDSEIPLDLKNFDIRNYDLKKYFWKTQTGKYLSGFFRLSGHKIKNLHLSSVEPIGMPYYYNKPSIRHQYIEDILNERPLNEPQAQFVVDYLYESTPIKISGNSLKTFAKNLGMDDNLIPKHLDEQWTPQIGLIALPSFSIHVELMSLSASRL